MKRFLYFIPDYDGAMIEPGKLGDHGLGHLAGEVSSRRCVGPTEGSGLLVCLKGDLLPAYDPESQDWQQVDGRWLGCRRGELPGPEDLVRADGIGGEPVPLEDGSLWLVPIARATVNDVTLPKTMGVDADGEFTLAPISRYQAIADDAERVWQHYARQQGEDIGGEPLTQQDAFRIVVNALAQNYRVTASEVTVLQLITTHNLAAILDQLVDVPALNAMFAGMAEAQKKTEDPVIPDTSATDDG